MNNSVRAQRLRGLFDKTLFLAEATLLKLGQLAQWMGAKLRPWAELKRVLGTILPAAVTVVTVVPWVVFGHRLPQEVAIFWDLEGDPVWQLPRAAAGALLGGLTIAFAVCVSGTVREYAARPISDSSRGALILGVLVFAQTTLAAVSLYNVVFSHLDAESLDDALLGGPGWFIFPVMMGLGAAEGAAGATRRLVMGNGGPRLWVPWFYWQRPPASDVPLAPGERVAWVGTCRSQLLKLVGLATVVLAVLLLISLPGDDVAWLVTKSMWVVLLLLFGVSFTATANTRVSVGAHGIRVHSEILPWPSIALPLSRIDMATATDITALWTGWGRGWGLRWGLRLAHRACWMVRQGEGLRLQLTDGRVFAVTVDDAESAAAVINGHLARAQDPRWSG